MQPRFDRGYTGHEMLCGFGLINMNGRLCDPYIQRFLCPDNVVQSPTNPQSYNRGYGGAALSYGLSYYEVTSNQKLGDTHTFVDLTVNTLCLAATIVGAVVTAPELVVVAVGIGVGGAIFGTVYGMFSICGGGDWIDSIQITGVVKFSIQIPINKPCQSIKNVHDDNISTKSE